MNAQTPISSKAARVVFKRAVRKVKALSPVLVAPALVLTPDEIRLIMAYRSADDASQKFALCTTESFAVTFARRVTPSLRLIAGGAA